MWTLDDDGALVAPWSGVTREGPFGWGTVWHVRVWGSGGISGLLVTITQRITAAEMADEALLEAIFTAIEHEIRES